MAGVYISYRRDGPSMWAAGRLADRLRADLGKRVTVASVDRRVPAPALPDAIRQTMAGCQVVVAVIGDDWLEAEEFLEGVTDIRRLDDEDDPVRLEIVAGLDMDMELIPVLLDGVPMPASTDLPERLRPMMRRHSLSLSAARFEADVDKLVVRLRTVLDVPEPATRRRRRMAMVAGAALLVAGASVFLATRGGDAPRPLPFGVLAAVDLGVRPGDAAVGHGAVWVADESENAVLRIDPTDLEVTASIDVAARPRALAITPKAVWVATGDGTVVRIDPASDSVAATVTVGFEDEVRMTATTDAVWLAGEGLEDIRRIDTATDAQTALEWPGIRAPYAIAASGDDLWLTDDFQGTLTRLDAATGEVRAVVELRTEAGLVTVSDQAVWVASANETVVRVDPATNEVRATVGVPTGSGIVDLDATGDGVWAIGADDTAVHLRVPVAGSEYPRRVVEATVETDGPPPQDEQPRLAPDADGDEAWAVTRDGVLVRVDGAGP